MDMSPTEEQQQIVDAARSFFGKELQVDHKRWEPNALAAKDRTLLATFGELGWFSMGLSEELGGVGLSAVEDMLLFREAGRHLVSPMLLAGVVAARIAPPELREPLLSGAARAGLAIEHSAGVYLIDAADADCILLSSGAGVALFPRAAFVHVVDVRSVDQTVTLQSADELKAEPLARGDSTPADLLSLLIAAMLCGAAEAVRDITVAHATERSQFGQKIGTFQAVSHPLAEMAVRCESAFAQTRYAAVAQSAARRDSGFHVNAARIVAQQAALANARAAIQLHGGMGFAAEYPLHLFLKRAHLLEQIGGRFAVLLDRFIGMEPA